MGETIRYFIWGCGVVPYYYSLSYAIAQIATTPKEG